MTSLGLQPSFPGNFSTAQLGALRDLTCYSLGFVSYDQLFPDDGSGLARPSIDEIEAFKVRGLLDYDATREKVRAVHARVFGFLQRDDARHTNLRHLIGLVYPPSEAPPSDRPIVMPPFPESLQRLQLEPLRALTCYALGLRKYKDLFPADADDGLPRPSDDDIRSFKEHGAQLDLETTQRKLRAIYTRVFQFLSESPALHRGIRPWIELVYPQHDTRRLDKAAEFFYNFFRVNTRTIEDNVSESRGVYILYRYGERGPAAAELVKSILAIYGRGTGDSRWLEFRLAYRGGRYGKVGALYQIKGVVVPAQQNYYFLGVDEGTGNSPCLFITRHPFKFHGTPAIQGLSLRLNTLGHISASRILCVRKSTTISQYYPNEDVDRMFTQLEDEANIYSRTDKEIAREIATILPNIDNRVDMEQQLTLRDLHQRESDT